MSDTALACVVDGCDLPVHVALRGLCNMHYQRWRTKGTTDSGRPDVSARLLAKRVIDGDCWVWTGKQNVPGYGVIWYDGRQVGVHRVAHMLWVGPIPEGYEVDHVKSRGCRRTECFNPAHLEAVPPRVNNMRSGSPAALNLRKVDCKYGHPIDGVNKKGRYCKTCNRLYVAAFKARKRLART